MKINKLLEYNGEIAKLLQDRELAVSIINAAYDHIKVRLSLYPLLVKCTLDQGINFNEVQPYSVGNNIGEIQFKEITDVIGQVLQEEQPHSVENAGIISRVNSGYSSDIPIYFSHNYLYAEETNVVSIPIIGHAFPPLVYVQSSGVSIPYVRLTNNLLARTASLNIPDSILFPLTAKIYALMALEIHNVQVSGAYDGLCNHYINIRNQGLLQVTPKDLSKIVGVTPYDLL